MRLIRRTKIRSVVFTMSIGLCTMFVFSLHAGAQSEIDYARRLADYGYFELARHQINQIENDEEVPDSVKSYLPVVRSYVSMREAERRDDLLVRANEIEEALSNLKSFVSSNPDHPKLSDARSTYAETLRKSAGLWKEIARGNPDRKQKAIKKALGYLKDSIKQYGRISDELEGFEGCDARIKQLVSRHEINRVHRLADRRKKRQNTLQNVLKGLGDFLWSSCASEYDILKMRARTYTGLSHLELSRVFRKNGNTGKADSHEADAQTYFNSVIELVDTIRDKTEIDRTKFTVVNNLVLRAYKLWMEYLYDEQAYKEVLKRVNNLQSSYAQWNHPFQPGRVNPASFEPGRAILLMKAKIYWERNRRQRALSLVERIANREGNDEYVEEARTLADKWSETLGPEPLTFQQILDIINEKLSSESYSRALAFVDTGLGRIRSREQSLRWSWRFLDRKARIYAEQERWYESATLYEHIHDRYHDVLALPLERDNKGQRTDVEQVLKNDDNDFQNLREVVLKANFQAARSYGMMRENSGFEQDEGTYQELLDHLSAEHPDTKWAHRTVVLGGRLQREKGNFEGAVERYKRAEEGTDVWEIAQVGLGLTYFEKGNSLADASPEKAKSAYLNGVETLRGLLNYYQEQSALSNSQKNRGWSAMNIMAYAFLKKPVKKPDELLDLLTSQRLSRFNVTGEKAARAQEHRMKAWIMKGEAENVAQVAENLYEKYPDAPATVSALGDAASYFERLRKKHREPEKVKAYRTREVNFYHRWISRKLRQGGASANNVLSIGIKLLEYGGEYGNEQHLHQAQTLFSTLLNRKYNERDVRLTGTVDSEVVREQLGRAYMQLGEFEQAQDIYDRLLEGEGATSLSVLMGRARLYIEQMKRAKKNGNSKKLKQLVDKADDFISGRIINAAEENGETWYRGWAALAEVKLIEGSDREQKNARFIFKRLMDRGEEPFNGYGDMFKKLLDAYPDKLGNLQISGQSS